MANNKIVKNNQRRGKHRPKKWDKTYVKGDKVACKGFIVQNVKKENEQKPSGFYS